MNHDISKIHPEILDEPRRQLLPVIAPLCQDFILGGGTALALQIMHRQSYDFDFFLSKEIPKHLAEDLLQSLHTLKIAVDNRDELTVFTASSIKISFISYPFHHLYPAVHTPLNIKLFDIRDIAAQKAYTIGRRGAYRDYFDIYSLVTGRFITINEIIESAEKIYGDIFNSKNFLSQLVYFDDLEDLAISAIDNSIIPTPDQIKSFFEHETHKFL